MKGMSILKISNLDVIYRVTRYVVAHLQEQEFVAELNKYLRLIQNDIKKETIEIPRPLIDKIRGSLELYRKAGYFNLYALNNINLELEKGKIMACVGESGCGKSTLALSILKILPGNAVAKGKIELDGKNIMGISEEEMRLLRATKIGYIGQGSYTYLNPLFTNAFQIIESAVVSSKESIEEAYNKFMRTIKEAQLDTRILLSFPMRLSGGEIRRVAFALALAKNPELLICDEPFRNIDIFMAKQLAYVLKKMIEKFKTTAIIFTHNLSLMAEMAEKIAVMYHGTIMEMGDTIGIFKRPYHPYTKGLIGALPDPRKPKKKIIYIPGEPIPKIVEPQFCPFFNRCPVADEECMQKKPVQREFEGRIVACHKIEEVWDKDPVEFWGKHIGI